MPSNSGKLLAVGVLYLMTACHRNVRNLSGDIGKSSVQVLHRWLVAVQIHIY